MSNDSQTQSIIHKLQALALAEGVNTLEARTDFLLERLVARLTCDET